MQIIKVEFTGEDRHEKVADYFRRYHPFGYNTVVTYEDDEKIVVERELACD